MASATKEVLTDLSPIIKVYTDGTVERLVIYPFAHPSPEDPNTGVASKDTAIPPILSARLYLPKLTNPTQKLPILLYFHGSAFCMSSAFSSYDHLYLNILSAASAALIITVEYRLAPEHPLPAAYDDSWDALKWICSHATSDQTGFKKDEWVANHGDFSRVFIGGDSSGANIAHNIAMRAGSESLPGDVKILGAIVSYPYFWGSNPVGNEPKDDLQQSLLYRLLVFAYPSAPGGIDDPTINPLAVGAPSLSGLGCSKMLVILAGKDRLTERSRVYAELVKGSGWKGEIEVLEIEDEDHGFHIFDLESHEAKTVIHRLAIFISH